MAISVKDHGAYGDGMHDDYAAFQAALDLCEGTLTVPPGTGCEPLWDERWFPIYRKIQDKKKNLVLLGGINECDEAGAERLIKTLDPVGFYIKCWSSTKQRGEQMVQAVTKWCE